MITVWIISVHRFRLTSIWNRILWIKRSPNRLILVMGNPIPRKKRSWFINKNQIPKVLDPWDDNPDTKVKRANMGHIWVLSAPDGPHVGPRNLAIREVLPCRRTLLVSVLQQAPDGTWRTVSYWILRFWYVFQAFATKTVRYIMYFD